MDPEISDSDIPEFPKYILHSSYDSGHEVIYCSTDPEVQKSGCYYGLLIAKLNGNFWVLTPIGVRYYILESQHEFVRRGNPEEPNEKWVMIDDTWKRGLRLIGELQDIALPFLPIIDLR